MAKKEPQIEETSVNDPAFGTLIYDGFHHRGWGGSFADPRFAGWGKVINETFPDRHEDEDEQEDDSSSATDFLSDLLAAAGSKFGDELSAEPEAAKMLELSRAFAARVDAYDGSLDADKLRRPGRFKVAVRNGKDTPPTPDQQAAWRAFQGGGDALAERIAAALLKTYTDQRPERLRWWTSVYGDTSDRVLPAVTTTQQMRDLVRPDEFRVYAEKDDGTVTLAIVFTTLWAYGEIKVSLTGGHTIARIGPVEHDHSVNSKPSGPVLESPVFGPLRWYEMDDAWGGTFHCPRLRGWHEASELRQRTRKGDKTIHPIYRPVPDWDVITADFGLKVYSEDGEPPSAAQEAVWKTFAADLDGSIDQVLQYLFDWYQDCRPDWLANMRGDEDDKNATMPPITSPDELTDFIEFSGVKVLEKTWRNDTPCAILYFSWFDEHGLAVRWREGKVETVGDFDSVEEG